MTKPKTNLYCTVASIGMLWCYVCKLVFHKIENISMTKGTRSVNVHLEKEQQKKTGDAGKKIKANQHS